jgi:hypothetical protein
VQLLVTVKINLTQRFRVTVFGMCRAAPDFSCCVTTDRVAWGKGGEREMRLGER